MKLIFSAATALLLSTPAFAIVQGGCTEPTFPTSNGPAWMETVSQEMLSRPWPIDECDMVPPPFCQKPIISAAMSGWDLDNDELINRPDTPFNDELILAGEFEISPYFENGPNGQSGGVKATIRWTF